MSLEMYTPEELAGIAKVHVRTIVRLAQEGQIPAFKFGGRWRFPKTDIDKYIEERSRPASRTVLLAGGRNATGLAALIENAGYRAIEVDGIEELRAALDQDPALVVMTLETAGTPLVKALHWSGSRTRVLLVRVGSGSYLPRKILRHRFVTVIDSGAGEDAWRSCLELLLG